MMGAAILRRTGEHLWKGAHPVADEKQSDRPPSEAEKRARAAEQALDAQAEMWKKMGFTVGGFEEAKAEARKTALARPEEAWFDEAVGKLVAIYNAHPDGFVKGSGGESEAELRRLGALFHQKGGMDVMRAAHAAFAEKCSVRGAPRNLEIIWDGIGEWMG
jgi:hypothetical protein